MKRILTVTLSAMLALSGCAPTTDKAAAVATDFLSEFFNMNYAGAAALCSDDIAAMLRDTIASDAYPSEEIRAKVIEASKNTTFKILSSEVDEESGEVVINYEISPWGAVGNTAIPRTMRLGRIDGDWRVIALE